MYFPADLVNKRTGDNWKYNTKTDVVIKNETVAGNVQPAANGIPNVPLNGYSLTDGNQFSARPLKHWRKQRTQVLQNHGLTNTRTLETTFQVPGGTNVISSNGSLQCEPCKNQYVVPDVNVTYRPKDDVNNKIGHFAPQTFSDYSDFLNQCPPNNFQYEKCVSVCDPEKNARQRVRYPSALNTNSSKSKYYTSNSSYLKARCKTYNQNQYQYGTDSVSKCENLTQPAAFRPNCVGCSNCSSKGICNQKVSYYKPNNCKFAVQGGVSSGLRVARLKYDTVNKFANGFMNNPNFGPSVANAYAYNGNSETPFTIKNKMFKCGENASSFRRTGNRNIKC